MTIEIKVLNPNTEADYRQLLANAPAAMFNHSLLYRKFLQKILIDAEDHYLLAYEAGELMAALPLFLKHGYLGSVVNSLPFYGSHGSVVAKSNAGKSVIKALLDAYSAFCDNREVISSILIESPIDPNKKIYSSYKSDYVDARIGQITVLPEPCAMHEVEDRLLSLYHQKTRNIVRKGLKSGFIVRHDGSQKTFEELHALHDENIRSIGGEAKPWEVFEAIRDIFQYDKDYRIYIAICDEQIVCALLVFYFKGIVEYFTPVTLKSYRKHQPLSLLIFIAMRDAVIERGSTHWNWGGTWLSQDGVYQFKSRWGTTDYPYRYHIKANRGSSFFQNKNKSDFLSGYPYFYIVPFTVLDNS